jgi:alkylation response protein AidB-like acyl-CoA dehydrogenase
LGAGVVRNAVMDGDLLHLPDAATRVISDFAARAGIHDRLGSFPRENFEVLHRVGLLSLTVPVTFGGQGRGLHEAARVIGTIAAGDASTALVLAMHYVHQAGIARATAWPAHLKARVARDAVADGALINALRVEPELGTPARGGLPATIARRVPEGWRISGHKIYATGIPALRWCLVWARSDEPEPRVGHWLVPNPTAGLRVIETWDHLGMRATGSHDVVLDDVLVPAEHAVDIRFPAAWRTPDPVQAAWNTLTIAALYNGVAQAARDWLITHLQRRVPTNLGAPLASLPRFQTTVGEIDTLLDTNGRLLSGATAEADRSGRGLHPADPGAIKYTVTNNAVRAVELGLGLIGNPGLDRRNPLERHYRDVLCSRIHTPQDDSVLLALGRSALGIA